MSINVTVYMMELYNDKLIDLFAKAGTSDEVMHNSLFCFDISLPLPPPMQILRVLPLGKEICLFFSLTRLDRTACHGQQTQPEHILG